MEKYSRTCRFVMSCNFSSKIIEPIQSRCAVFRFRPIKAEDVERYLKFVSGKEGLKVEKDGYESLTYLAQGDLRRAINGLQMAAAAKTDINADVVYQTVAAARPEEVKEALEMAHSHVGRKPSVTHLHIPPIGMVDVSGQRETVEPASKLL